MRGGRGGAEGTGVSESNSVSEVIGGRKSE